MGTRTLSSALPCMRVPLPAANSMAQEIIYSISSQIVRAIAAGSSELSIGLPTTIKLEPAAAAAEGVIIRFCSSLALPAGRMPGVTIIVRLYYMRKLFETVVD